MGEWSRALLDVIGLMGNSAFTGFNSILTTMGKILNGLTFEEFGSLVFTFGAVSSAATVFSKLLKEIWDFEFKMADGTNKLTKSFNALIGAIGSY